MSTERVMLLIDADNVSIDVMEQAVRLLLNQHGGLHVRRAYCTAESAVKHQAAFKRLSIKPMVNLAAGKNSTDIALAVDAVDLVLAERPDVVVIASSDSDFAPLVQRLREKGCVVRGIGQSGKTGDETQDVYDDFTVIEHRRASSAAGDEPVRKTARKAAAKKAPATKKAAAKKAAKAPAAKKAAAKAPAKTAAKATRKAAHPAAAAAPVEPVAAEPAPEASAAPPPEPANPPPAAEVHRAAHHRARSASSAAEVIGCLPELAAGQALALNVAVQRLREAQLLGRNSSSLKLFAQLADRFELLPPDKPTLVRMRREA